VTTKSESVMKVLFLDVDGVLNTFKTGGLYTLTKTKLKLLQEIVEATDCKIVLSSTWRKDDYAFRKLIKALSYRGMTIMSKTPVIYSGPRGLEIANWIVENGNVDRYAILDDNSDMLDNQLRNFFQTDGDYGLTKTIAHRIIQHLNTVT
jgi:hypothetical protein